jgi:hypothetical protein
MHNVNWNPERKKSVLRHRDIITTNLKGIGILTRLWFRIGPVTGS